MTPDVPERIRAAQIQSLYAGMPASYLGSVCSSSAYLAAAHTVLPTWQVLLWMGLMLLQALGRWLLWRQYQRRQPGLDENARWERYALLGSAVSGCFWGLGTWLVLPLGHIEYQLFYLLLIASMGSFSAIASAAHLPSFYAFTLPTVLPLAVAMMLQADRLQFALGLSYLVYLPVISAFAHNLHRSAIESFRLRFANLDLLRAVTERKEQAEEASREKSMFLAAASHDLRQPMHALSLQAHLLQKTALAPAQAQLLGAMSSSIQSMTGLFDALLDMSRLDAGVIPVREGPVVLSELFERLEREFRREAEAKQLRLRFRATSAVVRSDGQLLAALLGNLVSNAIRYTREGGVLVAARRTRRGVRVEVWDSGHGIAPQQQRAIFKAFYQVGNVERDRSKGLGLGLAIVERLSRLLKAPLELRSEPGRGSRFSLRLKAVRGAAAPRAQPPADSAAADSLVGALVVVVDNEADIRAAMAALLESWGCEVLGAGSADEALTRAAALSRAPDLVLSDYRLGPEGTGLQMIERLRDEFNHAIPALVLTGDTGAEVLREVVAAECALLHKPVQPERLQLSLAGLLAARPSR